MVPKAAVTLSSMRSPAERFLPAVFFCGRASAGLKSRTAEKLQKQHTGSPARSTHGAMICARELVLVFSGEAAAVAAPRGAPVSFELHKAGALGR